MKFRLRGIEIKVHLGVPETERAKAQTVLVSVLFEYDARKAEKSDDVRDTVDYDEIRTLILDFPKKKTFHLLEALHHELTNEISKKFPRIKNLKVKIKKFPFENGSVEVE